MSDILTENDKKWQELFERHKILDCIKRNGFFNISAAEIKKCREPRLMVKFDHLINLPKIFSEHKLAILPISRGEYMISHFNVYHRFNNENNVDESIIKATLPEHIQSLDSTNISSETIALNYAVASGIITDFLEDQDIFATVSGRMSSGKFSFNIRDEGANQNRIVNVNNSQIEIDAAYEGISCLALLEAKLDLCDDFLIRQLYYPFRTWTNKTTKPIKTIFLTYSNSIYRIFEYKFNDTNDYNSLTLVKKKSYSIEDTNISLTDIQSVLKTVPVIDEPIDIPFPQADKFERVVNLCELLYDKELKKEDITEKYDFDERQTDYYTNAARYLGLLEKEKKSENRYSLSNKGETILNLKFKQRQLEYCKCILSHKVFNLLLQLYFKNGDLPPTNEIVKVMKQSNLNQIDSDTTFIRRSSSIKSWLKWIVSLINKDE